MPTGARGSSNIPGVEVTSQRGGRNPSGHRVGPDPVPWDCSASGIQDPGRGAVRGTAATQLRGPKAAAMASHVRRLKLYPEPQTLGAEGTELGEALSLRTAPNRPPTNHQPEAGPQHHTPPSSP